MLVEILADLVLVKLDEITWPWVAPEADPRAIVLLRASARDVHTVLVNGEIVLENRVPTHFDADAVARELAGRLDASPLPEDRIASAEALRPHVEAWYEAWDVPPLVPWTHLGSRR